MDHPDPTGPDAPEEPTAARDAEPNGGGRNVADQAADEEELVPTPPPITADVPGAKQMTLAGMPKRKVPTRHEVVVHQKGFDAGGALDPTKEGKLLLTYRYVKEVRVPKMEGGQVVEMVIRHHVAPIHGMRPEQWEGWAEEAKAFHEREAAGATA